MFEKKFNVEISMSFWQIVKIVHAYFVFCRQTIPSTTLIRPYKKLRTNNYNLSFKIIFEKLFIFSKQVYLYPFHFLYPDHLINNVLIFLNIFFLLKVEIFDIFYKLQTQLQILKLKLNKSHHIVLT
mgnify:CR=1 FL=1